MSTAADTYYSAEAWNAHAPDYQHRFSLGPLSLVAEHIFPKLDAALEKASEAEPLRVFIGAGGDGAEVALIAMHYAGGSSREALGKKLQIVSTDFASAMTEKANKALLERAPAVAASGQIKFITADIQALGPDFADESFHLSLFTFGPAYVKDPEAAFKEIRRITKKGGRIITLSWKTLSLIDDADRARRNILGADTPSVYGTLVGKWGEEAHNKAVLEAAGFGEVEAKTFPIVLEGTDLVEDSLEGIEAAQRSADSSPTIAVLTEGLTAEQRIALKVARQKKLQESGVTLATAKVEGTLVVAHGVAA